MQTDAPDRILRIKAVMERTGLTRSTLYRKIESGSFPPQIKLSERCAGWRESDVSEWMRNPMSYSITTAAAVKFRSRATMIARSPAARLASPPSTWRCRRVPASQTNE